jgi:hypothetical protein
MEEKMSDPIPYTPSDKALPSPPDSVAMITAGQLLKLDDAFVYVHKPGIYRLVDGELAGYALGDQVQMSGLEIGSMESVEPTAKQKQAIVKYGE